MMCFGEKIMNYTRFSIKKLYTCISICIRSSKTVHNLVILLYTILVNTVRKACKSPFLTVISSIFCISVRSCNFKQSSFIINPRFTPIHMQHESQNKSTILTSKLELVSLQLTHNPTTAWAGLEYLDGEAEKKYIYKTI